MSYYSAKEIAEGIKNFEKHTKGYIYDSLVYRYKMALEESIPHKTDLWIAKHNGSRIDAERKVRDLATRDLMRFIEILNEGIGEHD